MLISGSIANSQRTPTEMSRICGVAKVGILLEQVIPL